MEYPKTLQIDGIEYVAKDSIQDSAESLDGMPFCIFRCDRSGVFAGYLKSRTGQEAVIRNARRIWYWSGAASLSQLAVDGTSKPNDCKFPVAIEEMTVTDVIEIIPASAKAKKSIDGVKVWQV